MTMNWRMRYAASWKHLGVGQEHVEKLNFAMNLANLEEARDAKRREIDTLEALKRIEESNAKRLKHEKHREKLEKEEHERLEREKQKPCSFEGIWVALFGVGAGHTIWDAASGRGFG